MKPKLLVIQRVITSYRYQLLCELLEYYEITILSSQGEKSGALKRYNPPKEARIEIKILNSLRINYSGESRSTSLFFYPQVIFYLKKYDFLLLEGTTNLLNNLFIIPIGRILGKKIIWWDAGYSLNARSRKRKIIDNVVKPLITLTKYQLAYSNLAKDYMISHMGAKNCTALINTISTTIYEKKKDLILKRIQEYKPTPSLVKLLYVGAIEERKKLQNLIDIVVRLNAESQNQYTLKVIGGGNYLEAIKRKVGQNKDIIILGPIYDFDELSVHYFNADLFVMPGDGGLGIVQALLFGLPAICTVADGTEHDYLEQNCIFNSLEELTEYLRAFKYPNKLMISDKWPKLYSSTWINGFINMLNR
jgi:glycosyltransferase involved in cell wall biosynthesis